MKNKNGLESTVFNVIKHGAAAIAVAGATYLGAYLAAPNYAYAGEEKSNVAEMNSDKFDLVPKDKKKEYCDVKEQKPEAKKDSPKPKGKKKAPEPKDDCYNLTLKEAGGKELPLENKYGDDGKCSYRSAQIEAGKEYVLSLNDANEFFNDMPVAEPYSNIETARTFYDSNGRARTIAFKTKGDISLTANLTNKNGAIEIDDELELVVKKAEAKKEEPKKEDFTPVPAPKPVEQQPPAPTPVAEEESELDADIAAQVDISYVQNTQDLSGSQIDYSGLRTGLVVAPSLRLSENASLGVYGKYAHTNFPSVEVNGVSSEGSKALEHEFGGGLLLNIKGNKDKTSRAGDLKVVIGGGYLGTIQQMEYMGYSFEQNQNGGDFMVAFNAPRLIYHPDGTDTNEDVNGVGLEGSANGRILRTSQNGPAGSYDRGARFDIKGNLALNATFANKIKAKLGWGGTSMDSLLVDTGRRNGSHLLVGIGSPDGEGFGWAVEGTVPYGVDNDEFGAEACMSYNNMRFCADGRRYSMPTGTGNGDSAGNEAIYTGMKASYSTDFDMALVRGLNRIFGGN